MTKEQILKALAELNKELKLQSVAGEISIVGGAVMCLIFNARESTLDVDALMAPVDILQKAAFNVSEALGLENNFWINDAIKVFQSENAAFIESNISLSNLKILVASPDYMFAMKALAARSGTNDEEDLIFLKNYLKLTELDQALTIIKKFYPEQKLSIESKIMLKDLFAGES